MIDKLLNCVKKKETDKEIKAFKVLCPLIEKYIPSHETKYINDSINPERVLRERLITRIQEENYNVNNWHLNRDVISENYRLISKNGCLMTENKELKDELLELEKEDCTKKTKQLGNEYVKRGKYEKTKKDLQKQKNENERLRNKIEKRKLKDERKNKQIKDLERKLKEFKNENNPTQNELLKLEKQIKKERKNEKDKDWRYYFAGKLDLLSELIERCNDDFENEKSILRDKKRRLQND